jgi:hypothetical protein
MNGFNRGAPQNWIARRNPWNLPQPPSWFLRKLYDRDPLLVIFPGIQAQMYRLARRSPAAKKARQVAPNEEVAELLFHGCVPVTSILPYAKWGDEIIQWLDDHDTWKAGGGEQYVKKLEANEAQAAAKLDAKIRDEAEQRAVSGYHALLNRTGNFHVVPDMKGGTQKRSAAVR